MVTFSAITAASDGKTAYITDGNISYTIPADDGSINDVLNNAGITLYSGDETIVTEQSGDTLSITIKRAFPVTVNAYGSSSIVRLNGGTVSDALKAAGVDAAAADFITPAPTAELSEGTEITVVKGVKVYLIKGGEETLVYVPEGTVKDALAYAGCELCSENNGEIKDTDAVKANMRLCVDEVFYRTTFVSKELPPKTVEEKTDSLKVGEKKLKTEGKAGKAEISYKEKYINGELVEKKEDKTTIKYKPVDNIILVGTAVENSDETGVEASKDENEEIGVTAENTAADIIAEEEPAVDTAEETVHEESGLSYKSVITGSCTAYWEPDGITATGTVPKVGTVAVDPSIIPYGTKLYIASEDGSYVYGYAVAEDTGGACMAGEIIADLYMNSEADCSDFGRRVLNVYILD